MPGNPVFVVHTWVAEHWLFKPLLCLIDHLAVDPTAPMGMKQVIRLIERGRPVVIFPEGRLTVTGSLMKIYNGPAFIAAKTGATVLPVHLDGPARTYFSRMGGHYPRRWLPKMRITIMPSQKIGHARGLQWAMNGAPRPVRRYAASCSTAFATRPQGTLYESLLRSHLLVWPPLWSD